MQNTPASPGYVENVVRAARAERSTCILAQVHALSRHLRNSNILI